MNLEMSEVNPINPVTLDVSFSSLRLIASENNESKLLRCSRNNNQHLLSVVTNILNANQNGLSSLDIRYIAYFYSVFPLHPNTFRQLFQHSIQPQLDQLKTLISNFFSLQSNLFLNSQILESFNDSYSTILKHIDTFVNHISTLLTIDTHSYIAITNRNLNSVLQSIHKILLSSINYVSVIIIIVVFYFNILLQIYYENFIKKLREYKSTVEEHIKKYIKEITGDLSKACKTIRRLNQKIQNIKSQIKTFDENYSKIGLISGYHSLKSIINPRFQGDIGSIYQIFLTLIKYRNDLRIFKKHTKNLTGILSKLEFYSNAISKIPNDNSVKFADCRNDSRTIKNHTNIYIQFLEIIDFFYKLFSEKEKDNSEKLSDYISSVHAISGTLDNLKIYLDEFEEYVKKAKLKEISEHIKKMKSLLNKVQSSVKPEFKKYIDNLSNIDIDYNKIQKLNKKIKNFNTRFIKKFNIANKSIELYKSLDSEASKLTGVTFTKYDISELIKNSSEIKQRLESFETISVSTNSNTQTIPSEIKETQKQYSSDVSSYQSRINYLLYEISVLIYTYYLLQIMILYSTKISDMPNKIKEITDIDKAVIKLPEIVKELVTFYRVHNSSMNILIVFHFISFARFYINKYVYNFILVNYYTEVLIFSILCYIKILSLLKFLQDVLQSIISNRLNLIPESKEITKLTDYSSNIITLLRCINCHLVSLKTLGGNLNVKNVKYNLDKIRTCIKEISEETNQVKNNIDYLNKGILKLYIINFKIIYIKMYVGQIIKKIISLVYHTYIYYLMNNLSMAKRYTKKEKTLVFLIHSNSIFNVVEIFKKIEKEISMSENIYKGFIGNFISQLISVTNNIEKLTREMDEYVKIIQKVVIEVECAIEGVVLNFIKCTIKSLTDKIISNSSSTIIRDDEVDNQVMGIYSLLNVNQYKDLVNRMLEFWTFSEDCVYGYGYILFCPCAKDFKSKYKDEAASSFNYGLPSIKTRDVNPVSELVRLTMAENVGNHMCLCLVIKYHLRPSLLKCILYLRNEELGTLDTISRKFDNYNSLVGYKADLWKLCELFLNIIYELTSLLRNRYLIKFINVCMCSFYDEKHYNYFVSIILVLSSLMENIWSMDAEILRMAIENLSTLYSQLESYDLYSLNDTKKLSCNSIYTLVVDKQCQDKGTCPCKESGKCCCCSIIVNVLMIYISLCIQCKLCNAICNNKKKACDKVKEFCNIEDCKCKCQEQNNGLCCLLKLSFSGVVGSEELQKVFEKCCKECTGENDCCKKILAKVKAGLCKLLLLGCNCNCTSDTESGQVEGKCLIFKDFNECTSVAVVVFCKCAKGANGCCCLYTLVEKLESKMKKICEDDCCFKELKDGCKDLCCDTGCEDGCVCKELKKSLETICKGCNGDDKCLCQEIDKIKECFNKCKDICKCKNKEGCCRCRCCKLVGMSIKILTRVCRANVLDPYKRIVLELLNSTKNKKEVIRTIVEVINATTLNNIYLVKNSRSSYPYSIGSYTSTINSVTNVEARNWGYDTKFEHDVTNDRGFTYNYPDINNNTANYGSGSSNKAFKMILSRLLVGGVIVFMFLYLRVSYSINNPFCIL